MRDLLGTILIALASLSLASSAGAAIHRVGSGEALHTIGAAYTAASSGDTILVGADAYTENLTLAKSLTITGSGFGSPGACVLNGTVVFNPGSAGSVLEGLVIQAPSNVVSAGAVADLTLRRCRIEQLSGASNYMAVRRSPAYAGRLTIEDCELRNNTTYGQGGVVSLNLDSLYVYNTVFAGVASNNSILGTASSLVVENCAFLNAYRVFNITGWCPLLAANNVFYDWRPSAAGFGIYPNLGTWEYNAASEFAAPGTGAVDLTANPFLGYSEAANYEFDASDLRLDPVNGASCIDSGSPALTDLLDGSPCDRGVHGARRPFVDGGTPSYPFVTSLVVPGSGIAGQPLAITATARIGREN